MRHNIIITASCIAASLMLAGGCNIKQSEPVTVSFEVTSPSTDEIVLVYDWDIHPVKLDESGKASFSIEGKDFLYCKIFYGQEYVNAYFKKGEATTMTFDGSSFRSTWKFSGGTQQIAEYLNNIAYTPLPDEDFALELEEYKSKLKAKEESSTMLLEKYNNGKLDKDFVKTEKSRIIYSYGAQRLMYSVGYPIMTSKADYTPNEAYYDYIKELFVENEALIDLEEYRDYMLEANAILNLKGKKVSFYEKTISQMEYFSNNFKDGDLKEYLIYQCASSYIDQMGTDNVTDLNNLFYSNVKDAILLASFKEKCDKWDFSAPGRISPDFNAENLDGKTVRLKDFRGKYVYIDLWATWCQPCRKELPHLKALEEKFHGRNIHFVSVSVDDNKDSWRKFVTTQKMEGNQLYLGSESKFLQDYRVNGIPRFILLDPNGIIVDNNMIRPSDSATSDRLSALEGI